jgi:hypothetical protein
MIISKINGKSFHGKIHLISYLNKLIDFYRKNCCMNIKYLLCKKISDTHVNHYKYKRELIKNIVLICKDNEIK